MNSVARTRQHSNFDVLAQLDEPLIDQLAHEQGHHWRQGKLSPARTIHFFAWQVLMGNVSGGAVRHHANAAFSESAYCQARQRLPQTLLHELSQRTAQAALSHTRHGRKATDWHGHRVFRIDGSSATLSDAKAVRDHFGCSKKQRPGCGYPTAHLLVLTGPAGIGSEVIASPLRSGDMTHAAAMHTHLQAGDVLLGDEHFGGWAHLQQLIDQQLHGVFPAHHARTIGWGKQAEHGNSRRFVKTLGYHDQLVEYRKPAQRPPWMSKQAFAKTPPWITVREIKREVKIGGRRREIIVVTTLLDAKKYPPKQVVKLLADRWLIETQLRSLKTTMGMETLRCQSVDGVQKELLIYLIVYNLVRLLMLQAALRQHSDPNRISFADALAKLRWGDLLLAVELKIVPERPGRIEPRVVKRRRKPYARMCKPRWLLRELIKNSRKVRTR